MRREDGGERRLPVPQNRQSSRTLPFVKVGQQRLPGQPALQGDQELGHDAAEADDLVEFEIPRRGTDPVVLPQVVLDFRQARADRAGVHQQHLWSAGDQPAPGVDADPGGGQFLKRVPDRIARRMRLKLDVRGSLAIRPDQPICIPPPPYGGRRLAAEHGVNATDLRADLPRSLEQQC